jgi:chromosomal replication initiator protein
MTYTLTPPLITSGMVFANLPNATIRPRLNIDRIKRVVGDYYNVSINELNSSRRARDVARPRQVAMYLAKELTPKSLPVIGREFNRDHTTVIHALRQINHLRLIDGDIADDIIELRARLAA